MLDVGAGTGRVALPLAARRPRGHRARHRRRSCSPSSARARRAAGVDVATVVADAADFTLAAPVGADHRADADDPAAARARRASSPSRAPRARARRPRGDRDRDRAGGLRRRRRRCPLPDLGEADGWTLRLPAGRDPARLDDGVRIERIRQLIAPDGDARRPPTTRSRSPTVTPGEPGRGGRRARPGGRGAAPHPRDARARRLRGGDPPWLTPARLRALSRT